jgi:hypothetical protein
VEFCFYLPQPLISDVSLQKLFAAGFQPANPVEAYMVGTIGVWGSREPGTSSNDRLLLAAVAATSDGPTPMSFGPATARVQPDRKVVSLDLISTFPEANYDRPPTVKSYIGPVRLGLIPPGQQQPVAISEPIAYGHDQYVRTGGIVDVPYSDAATSVRQLADGTLVLLADWVEPPILTEAGSTFTLETDDQALYLDVGEKGMIHILVRERGRPPGRDVILSLWEYQFVVSPPQPGLRATSTPILVQPAAPLEHRIKFPERVTFPAHRDTPIAIDLHALRPGSLTLAFTTDGEPPRTEFPVDGYFYVGVRVMPEDDYSKIPEATRLSWDFLYDEVFRYYYLIYPAMARIIPLNDRAGIEKAAPEIVRRTDPKLWPTTRYMPVSRDLSRAKRDLIVAWAASLKPAAPAAPRPRR